MADTPTPIKIWPSDLNKLIRIRLKQLWPLWKASQYRLKKDPHGNNMSYLTYFDHVPYQVMADLFTPWSKGNYLGGENVLIEWDGKTYSSPTRLFLTRIYSESFLTRVATIFCRRHQIVLPEVIDHSSGAWIRQEKNEPVVDGLCLSKAIIALADRTDAEKLEQLEKETDAQYPLLPLVSSEQKEERKKGEKARLLRFQMEREIERQALQFQIALYRQLPTKTDQLADCEGKASELAKTIRRQAPDLYEPVFCIGCNTYIEEPEATIIERPEFGVYTSLCRACVEKNTFVSYPVLEHIQKELRELEEQEKKGEQEPYIPVRNPETGFYLARNGENMPILTRDLLHDTRTSKWWLWFGKDEGGKLIPNREIRKAMKEAGWGWGYRRCQYHTSSPFGILQIPEIVYEQYGGYIDGGFCDYRSTRGQRLREYAEKVDEDAEEMAEWSESIVARYMATGSIVTGGRRTRKLQKEKARAEKKAAEARRLDQYADELRKRANRSEVYQYKLVSDAMLPRRLDTLRTEYRSYDNGFHKEVDATWWNIHYRNASSTHSLRWLVNYYEEYVQPRQELIQEEINLIESVIEARKAGRQEEPEQPVPVPIPEAPERSFSVNQVIEVNVGRDNYSELFPTPPDIADITLNEFPIPDTAQFVLEPHGGTGSYLARIRHHLAGSSAQIHTYELLYDLNKYLIEQGYQVLGTDFLAAELTGPVKEHGGYDDIIANPPFRGWEKHLVRAWRLGRPGCRIRCTILRDANLGSRSVHIMQEQASEYRVFDLPDDAFKQSGTNVRTSVIYLVKKQATVSVGGVSMVLPTVPGREVEKKRMTFTEMPSPLPVKKKKKEEALSTEIKQENLF